MGYMRMKDLSRAMHNEEFLRVVKKKCNVRLSDLKIILGCMGEAFNEVLLSGRKIFLRGFLRAEVKMRRGRKRKDLKTGELVKSPDYFVPIITPTRETYNKIKKFKPKMIAVTKQVTELIPDENFLYDDYSYMDDIENEVKNANKNAKIISTEYVNEYEGDDEYVDEEDGEYEDGEYADEEDELEEYYEGDFEDGEQD